MKKFLQVSFLVLSAGVPLVLVMAVVVLRIAGVSLTGPYDFRGDAYWKLNFVQGLPDVLPASDNEGFGMHDVHPTRGWTPKANRTRPGSTLRLTNNKGHRSIQDYSYEPGKFIVMIVGDSLSYGLEDDNEGVWPIVLQQLDARLSVVNLAVSGYGADQMYITLRESIEEYKPHLVIFPPISDDLNRSLLTFREYQKPRFILDGAGELQLTNVPVGAYPATAARIRDEYGGLRGRLRLAFEDRAFRQRMEGGEVKREWAALNTRIVEEAIACTRQHGAEFLLVHLACNLEISGPAAKKEDTNQTEDLLRKIADEKHVAFLPTRPAFVDLGTDWTPGHYSPREAQFVAKLVYERIQQQPSWKAFCAK